MRLYNKIKPISKLSNIRITRLESDIELTHKNVPSRLINRNPRNLEQLAFEHKPRGFWLDKRRINYWNKLVLSQTDSHLDAHLMHWSGKKLVSASTNEPQLSKYFNSGSTTQAAVVLGQVISRRCLQSGFINADPGIEDMDSQGIKVRSFYDAVVANGFVLEEPENILPRTVSDL